MGQFDAAQICVNGHIVNAYFKTRPQFNKPFCDKCGAKTLNTCQNCGIEILGNYIYDEYEDSPIEDPARAFCHSCGKPYPWMEEKLQAAKELADELVGLTDEEKETLAQSLGDIVRETPRTELATTRFKKFIDKSTGPAVQAMRRLFVDIASETAAKLFKEL